MTTANLIDLFKRVGWSQASSEHGTQFRSDLKPDGSMEADMVSWNGNRLTLDSERVDNQGSRSLVSAIWKFKDEEIDLLHSSVDGQDVDIEQALAAYNERTAGLGMPQFQPSKSYAPSRRTKSGHMAL
jgi:hypothetical protein